MVFSSHLFVYGFLPVALAVYYLLPRRARHLGLTILSYIFYGWSNPAFMGLMLLSTVVDYFCGLGMVGQLAWGGRGELRVLDPGGPRSAKQRIALTISIITNLSLLGFFKYFNFGVDSYNAIVGWLGIPDLSLETTLRVVLPLGISFYTFQSMSYSIDVFRGRTAPLRNFIDFACYVSMFPQLVAGPIIRFSEVADQLKSRSHTLEKFSRGVAFFSLGMAKKVLLANPCGKVADVIFDAGSALAIDAWYGLAAYSFQIYFDFSGYSDMAIGLGLMLGFVFPKNFDSPYKSESITEFWRRWHISLSTWLRDYLYVPLGGNRYGRRRTYVNLAVVMLLGGLWHGAAWNFVIWGGFHGVLLTLERVRGKRSHYGRWPRFVRVTITFLLVSVGWVFFRAADLPGAMDYLATMVGAGALQEGAGLVGGVVYQPYYLLTVVIAALIALGGPQTWDWTRRLSWPKAVTCAAALIVALLAMATQEYNPFIYFIF